MTTDDDVKAQLAYHRDMASKGLTKLTKVCPLCNEYMIYVPYDRAVEAGHIYSTAGMREVNLTGWCEFCFDNATKEPDEEDDNGLPDGPGYYGMDSTDVY